MEDKNIVDLYWERSENAIKQTDIKYGKLLFKLSFQLLSSREDAEECVNDTYVAAWEAMPEERPDRLCAFLCKIDRRISINKYRYMHRQKRGGADLIVEELTDCIPSGSDEITDKAENDRLSDTINGFLGDLSEEKRVVFVKRYFYSEPISEISSQMKISEGKIKTMLYRMRLSLLSLLEKEGLL